MFELDLERTLGFAMKYARDNLMSPEELAREFGIGVQRLADLRSQGNLRLTRRDRCANPGFAPGTQLVALCSQVRPPDGRTQKKCDEAL
jgi:hypothetical protein